MRAQDRATICMCLELKPIKGQLFFSRITRAMPLQCPQRVPQVNPLGGIMDN